MGKRSLVLFFAALSSVLLATSAVQAQENAPDYAQALEKLRLYSPEDPSARKYLGLKDKDAQFFINQIDAELLLIEIFSMYCPHCQKHAPEANRLFEIITGRKDLKDRLKLIGIGVGNSPFEVKIFREKYSVAFPLLDDRDSAATNALSGVLTPHYVVLRLHKGGKIDVLYSDAGGFDDAEEFLKMVLSL